VVEADFRAMLAAFGDGRPADGLREAVQGEQEAQPRLHPTLEGCQRPPRLRRLLSSTLEPPEQRLVLRQRLGTAAEATAQRFFDDLFQSLGTSAFGH
jgi:hypothetical protein